MKVNADIEPERPHTRDALHHLPQPLWRVDPVQPFRPVHLDGREALRAPRGGPFEDVRRLVPTDPAVHFDSVAHFAAEELVDGYPEPFAFDVPERDVEPGEGGLVVEEDPEACRRLWSAVCLQITGTSARD